MLVPNSIKTTSVKPSGTVHYWAIVFSRCLHYPESRFYIRRIRLSKHSELLEPLEKAGYKIEPGFGSEDTTMVVEVLVGCRRGDKDGSRTFDLGTIQFKFFSYRDIVRQSSKLYGYNLDPEKEGDQIPHVLNYYQYHLKGISLLPRHDYGGFIHKCVWNG